MNVLGVSTHADQVPFSAVAIRLRDEGFESLNHPTATFRPFTKKLVSNKFAQLKSCVYICNLKVAYSNIEV